MKNLKEIKLNDFYQAVILKTAGYPLLRLEKRTGHLVTFVFLDKDLKAEVTIKQYWNRELQLTARDIIENINELKTRIYNVI